MVKADRVNITPPLIDRRNRPAAPARDRPPSLPRAELYFPTGMLSKTGPIDRLLAFLDPTDVGPDLEPSLGFPEVAPRWPAHGHLGVSDDRADADFEAAGGERKANRQAAVRASR